MKPLQLILLLSVLLPGFTFAEGAAVPSQASAKPEPDTTTPDTTAASSVETEFNKCLTKATNDTEKDSCSAQAENRATQSACETKIKAAKSENEQLRIYKEECPHKADHKMTNFTTTDENIAWLALGVKQMPSYDTDGKSTGFNQSKSFGRVTYNDKFGNHRRNGDNTGLFSHGSWGWLVEMDSKPVYNEDKATANSTPKTFNDVAGSMTFSTSRYVDWAEDLSLGVTLGTSTREQLASNLSGLNSFIGFGTHYVKLNDVTQNRNGVPDTYLDMQFVQYSDYGGFKTANRNTRFVIEGGYRIPNKPVMLQFNINGGAGPDEVSIGLSYLFDMVKFVDLFSG